MLTNRWPKRFPKMQFHIDDTKTKGFLSPQTQESMGSTNWTQNAFEKEVTLDVGGVRERNRGEYDKKYCIKLSKNKYIYIFI